MLINRLKLWIFNNLSFLGFDKKNYIKKLRNDLIKNNVYIFEPLRKDTKLYGYKYSEKNTSYIRVVLELDWTVWKCNMGLDVEQKSKIAVCDFYTCLDYLKRKKIDENNFKIVIELSYDNQLPLCHYFVYYKDILYKEFYNNQRVSVGVLASWLLNDKNKDFFYMHKIKENEFHKELQEYIQYLFLNVDEDRVPTRSIISLKGNQNAQ